MHQLQAFIDDLHGRSVGESHGPSDDMTAAIICLVAAIVIVGSPVLAAVLDSSVVLAVCHLGAAAVALAMLVPSHSNR
jgi:hypothetical protein